MNGTLIWTVQLYIVITWCYITNTAIETGFNLAIRGTTNCFWKLNVDADVATGGDRRSFFVNLQFGFLESDCEIKFII